MNRVILHSDMNSFYASVECLYHPEIRNKPVAVCGDAEQRHGIVLAKNIPAKKCGVATGEAIWQAKQKCPELVTVSAHYDLYMRVSALARKIYARYTDRIEPFGLDECWLDLTGCVPPGHGEKVAQEIRDTIKNELGITVSVGVSWNKIFAKLGSDYKKPDAVTVITRDNYRERFWPLPACDLLYVGPATSRKFARYGIRTIGQLAQSDPDFLSRLLGKWGGYLWAFANGHDSSPVAQAGAQSVIKSIGNSMTTFRDAVGPEEAWQVLTALSESVARRLRENGFRCTTVHLSARDTDLAWLDCQTRLPSPCCTVEELAHSAMRLLDARWDYKKPMRSLGVRACNLTTEGPQTSLFEDTAVRERRERLENCVDRLRGRFGSGAVLRATLLQADIVRESDPLTHEVHPVGFFGR